MIAVQALSMKPRSDAATAGALAVVWAIACSCLCSRYILIAQPRRLQDFAILTLPGGFSYGDDIAAGKILARQLIGHLADMIREFIQRQRLVIGICNGFQVLVKAGLLPGGENEPIGPQVV